MDWTQVDLAIIGGGPAGVTAAIYAGGYGLKTVIIEQNQLGTVGRAGTSPYLENCPGFEAGISGQEFSRRLRTQALKMGAQFVHARVTDMMFKICYLDTGEKIRGRAVLIASGRTPKRLEVTGAHSFYDDGVFHEPPPIGRDVEHKRFCIVGGGNPAGQVAGYLARKQGTTVHIVAPKKALKGPAGFGMSQYLSERLSSAKNVFVHEDAEVIEVLADDRVTGVILRKQGDTKTINVDEVYSFTGSSPNTDWIGKDTSEPMALDRQGRIAIDRATGGAKYKWMWERSPFRSETSDIGVFAAGDVCVDGLGTILGAYGHAAMALQDICAYLRL